jgi:hypothetical protein
MAMHLCPLFSQITNQCKELVRCQSETCWDLVLHPISYLNQCFRPWLSGRRGCLATASAPAFVSLLGASTFPSPPTCRGHSRRQRSNCSSTRKRICTRRAPDASHAYYRNRLVWRLSILNQTNKCEGGAHTLRMQQLCFFSLIALLWT